jgi:pyridoxamine 5'-phosphate oxidase
VRVEGRAERLPEADNDAYFKSRPRGSQWGAWTSNQSEVVADRKALEARLAEIEASYPEDVPRPPFWGGYRIVPNRVEFWQGRPSRLHDRLIYRAQGEAWTVERLAP